MKISCTFVRQNNGKNLKMKVAINYKYSSRNIFRAEMSNININDFWIWLNNNIPSSEARKLLDIVDCDYKRKMIYKYLK